MTKALYAFSGDPITYKHIDIIERASKVFEELVIVIRNNPKKKYTFSLAERIEMVENSLSKFSNVKIISLEGLIVDYAYKNNIPVIIKSVISNKNFNYKKIICQFIKNLQLGIDTYFLIAKPELSHVSSSMVKSIQKKQRCLTKYVPLNVKQALEERISKQYLIGITGEVGVGKSYVSKKFKELALEKKLQAHIVDLDSIGHKILSEWKEPLYVNARKMIAESFGSEIKLKNNMIDRGKLGKIVFNDYKKWDELDEIMKKPLIEGFRKEISDKKGLIIVEGAIIIEKNWSHLFNNNIVLVHSNKKVQKKRLKDRGWSNDKTKQVIKRQYSYAEKKKFLEKKISEDNHGTIFEVYNSENLNSIKNVFEEIIKKLKIK